jgi:hypothetical protein
MLVAKPVRGARFLAPLVAISIFISVIFYEWDTIVSYPKNHILPLNDYFSEPITSGSGSSATNEQDVDPKVYREVYSASTSDGKYFFIDFIDRRSINPNIIPHPSLANTWIIVAQLHDPDSKIPMYFAEITCNAAFQHGALRCLEKPTILPVNTTAGDKCEGKYVVLNLSQGPHDARAFYGPDAPYTVYGSNSGFTCFGQFIHDLRSSLVEWGNQALSDDAFINATELQRPLPYGSIEKNWFVFWDRNGQMYTHYDVSPKRVFAKLAIDGSVKEDLAPQAALAGDEKCMENYMPRIGLTSESIHQATNSLAVTLCKRSDPSCIPDDSNTFIFTIFQHKRYLYFHSVYEPYVMLFEQNSPFKIYGISSKPFWVHGRWKPDGWKPDSSGTNDEGFNGTMDDARALSGFQPEMMYITSMSWKSSAQKYHGFIDDVLFLAFGIEDFLSAGIDVVVGDLLSDIAFC